MVILLSGIGDLINIDLTDMIGSIKGLVWTIIQFPYRLLMNSPIWLKISGLVFISVLSFFILRFIIDSIKNKDYLR